jgi:hypothetical protein
VLDLKGVGYGDFLELRTVEAVLRLRNGAGGAVVGKVAIVAYVKLSAFFELKEVSMTLRTMGLIPAQLAWHFKVQGRAVNTVRSAHHCVNCLGESSSMTQ